MTSGRALIVPLLCLLLVITNQAGYAQGDSIKPHDLHNFISSRKGIFGSLIRNLLADTSETQFQRNDVKYQRFQGQVIRNINIKALNFGIAITDTNKNFSNGIIKIANVLHRKTREHVIYNNLFFRKGQKVQPFLIADNERHLRDQPYLQDASIEIQRVPYSDSVDITILVKDVFSIGGSITALGLNGTEISFSEENFEGFGDGLRIQTLYDNRRANHFGYGVEYAKRNLGGEFIDAYVGYQNFNRGITGRKEENISYLRLIKALVNPYMKWTYALDLTNHVNSNMYLSDSVYNNESHYRYYTIDAWAGFNVNLSGISLRLEDQRLRALFGLRVLQQQFTEIPLKYTGVHDYRYADLSGVLGSISVLRQDFYKTKYIYGFGRNEDVPEGVDITLTGGYIRKEGRNRGYLGLAFERYYFSTNKHYFNFTARADGYFARNNFEDINLLANISYFNKLREIGKWKQRTFVSLGVARQYNSLLNEPLFLESDYGLPEFSNGSTGGYFRATFKSEVVFYSPASILLFRVAPFVFYNASLFSAEKEPFSSSRLFTSVGAGVRIRNESLIFGTIEVRGYFFPRQDSNGQSFKIDINSNIKFKYNSQLIKRPEFVHVN